jgi:molybdenum cofactor biosynthesis enzyme MoaA
MIRLLEPEENTFGALMVDLTHKCNMECANCYIPNREIPDMDVEKLYGLIKKLPTRTFIRLIGAEATMRDDLFDIIKNIKSMGHRVSLTTNGLKLGRKEYVKQLKDVGLRLVLLSMNGCLDDNVYKELDNGKYATLKHRALINLLDHRFIVNTGTIIAKNINEHTIKEQVELINKYTEMYSLKISPVVRLRTIATLGRSMASHTYEFEEFKDVVCSQLNISNSYLKTHVTEAKNNTSGLVFDYKNIKVRLVDWKVNDEGIPDFGNEVRGRVTQDFKIAPFFDHVKENEYGY